MSSYNKTTIHPFCLHGKYFVLDINSGTVLAIDRIAYDFLIGNTAHITPSELSQIQQEVDELRDDGFLFTDDILDAMPPGKSIVRNPVVKALCMHMAHGCNLRCEYCFAGAGEYNGCVGLMSLSQSKRAIEFLIEQSGTRKNLEVDFFGGEPLLNFSVIKQTVAYARSREQQLRKNGVEKNFRFTLTTNGLLLDKESIDYIAANMQNVVLSLDGRPNVNDRVRVLPDGSGCYSRVLESFLQLAKKCESYYVRGTFTAYNLDFSKDVEHLYNLGFKNISMEPVTAPSHMPYAIKEQHVPEILEEYQRLALFVQNHPDLKFFHFMIDLNSGPCIYKKVKGCGAGSEYLAVTPTGHLSACHQLVGDSFFDMGTTDKPDFTKRQMFEDVSICSKEKCMECFARFYCSGGCMAHSYKYAGGMCECEEIYCALMRKRVECAIYVQDRDN